MSQFWEHSWNCVDQKRVSEYIHAVELTVDPIAEDLKRFRAETVCDAGCGCGAYAQKLAANGFRVFAFDISAAAVEMARNLDCRDVQFKTADVLSTGYRDQQFDAVVSRDVIDHMAFRDAIAAVKELYRITRAGGVMILTLDRSDDEYEREPHLVNADGDYQYTDGKWKGMVFHPYSETQISELVQAGKILDLETGADGFKVTVLKPMSE